MQPCSSRSASRLTSQRQWQPIACPREPRTRRTRCEPGTSRRCLDGLDTSRWCAIREIAHLAAAHRREKENNQAMSRPLSVLPSGIISSLPAALFAAKTAPFPSTVRIPAGLLSARSLSCSSTSRPELLFTLNVSKMMNGLLMVLYQPVTNRPIQSMRRCKNEFAG